LKSATKTDRKRFRRQVLRRGQRKLGLRRQHAPEYYADEYRRYQTYCRDYGDNKLFRIACGPSDADYAGRTC
jgi:predicted solute-binding protein